MGSNGLLLVFICNHCPYVIAIIDRLGQDMKILEAEGIGCAAIIPNDYRDYPADAPEKMSIFAQQHGLEASYLVDHDQSVGRAYGAVCTPDFFGFDSKGGCDIAGGWMTLACAATPLNVYLNC